MSTDESYSADPAGPEAGPKPRPHRHRRPSATLRATRKGALLAAITTLGVIHLTGTSLADPASANGGALSSSNGTDGSGAIGVGGEWGKSSGGAPASAGVNAGDGTTSSGSSSYGGSTNTAGAGLANLQARADQLGGTFTLTPNQPTGTIAEWATPMPDG